MKKSNKKFLLILFSYHHKNTEKLAKVFSHVLEAPIENPLEADAEKIHEYDLVGFGSGIYSDKHHKTILDFVEKIPEQFGKKAFIFSTDGAPRGLMKEGSSMLADQTQKNHQSLREKLQAKGYEIIDEFNCGGWNTNSFLKVFGGINKGKPNEQDFSNARKFAQDLLDKIK